MIFKLDDGSREALVVPLPSLLKAFDRYLGRNAAVATDAIIANAAVTSRPDPVVNRAAASPTDRPAWNGDSRTV